MNADKKSEQEKINKIYTEKNFQGGKVPEDITPGMIRVCQYLSFPAYARKGDNFTNPNDSIAKYAHDNWTYEVRGEDPHASSGKEDANASGVSNPSLSFQSLNISTFGEESQNSAQYLLNHFVGRSRNTETELSTEKQVVTTTAEGHAESHDAASHVALGESSD